MSRLLQFTRKVMINIFNLAKKTKVNKIIYCKIIEAILKRFSLIF